MKFSLTPDVENDRFDIAAYLTKDSQQLALDFFDEFTAACTALAEIPEMAQMVPEFIPESAPILSDCRRWPIKRFRDYLIFYKPGKKHLCFTGIEWSTGFT